MPTRTDIGNAIKTAVTDSGAIASGSCEIGRVDPWPLADLPAARVRFDGEEIEHAALASAGKRTRYHTGRWAIEIHAQKTATLTVEDNLHTILETIEDQIDNDTTLGVAAVDDAKITEITAYELTADADKPSGSTVATVEVVYTTVEV